MLVFEDLHWADQETLALLEYLADNLAAERVLCLATLRDEGGELASGDRPGGDRRRPVDRSGHMVNMEQPAVVNDLLIRLCVDTSPRPAVTETPLDHLRSLS